MDDDELYQHAMGPMTHLINEQHGYNPQYPQQIQPVQYQQYTQQFDQNQQVIPPNLQQQLQQPYYPQQNFPNQQQQQLHDQQYLPQQQQQHLQKILGSLHQEPPFLPYQPQDALNQSQYYELSNQYNLLHASKEELLKDAHLDRESQSSIVSQGSHPIQVHSSIISIQAPTTVESTSTPTGTSSISSYSSKNSPYNVDSDRSRNLTAYSTKDYNSPSSHLSNKSGKDEIFLIPHKLNEPKFDMTKNMEFFDETIPNAFARIFLLKEVFFRLISAFKNKILFEGMLLQGLGVLSINNQNLEVLFLKYRGHMMNVVRNQMSDINDDTSELLLILTSILNSSSIYVRNCTMKDFFSLASGPSVMLKSAFEDPSKFPKSFMKLKNHADGLLFTARSVWNPRYNHNALYELLDVVKEFGLKYIDNDDEYNDDDLIRIQYGHLLEFIEYALTVLEGERSNKHVLCYPIGKIFKLVQLWYHLVPSDIYTFGSHTSPVAKVFYVLWFALCDMLEEIFVGGRYIFTFLFNGYYVLFPFDKNSLYYNLEDVELRKYANYACRILAFLTRRKAYVVRNTVLNDPIPAFFDSTDRFKPRSLDIHERCITSFKTTIIKPYHYPSESTTSGNLTHGSNYYKAHETNEEDLTSQLLKGLDTNLGNDSGTEPLLFESDFTDIVPETSLLKDDYDPRFTDPIFQTNVVFQNADLSFLNKYHTDRKLIIQLDMKD